MAGSGHSHAARVQMQRNGAARVSGSGVNDKPLSNLACSADHAGKDVRSES
jgi:hypothetical protein